MSAATTLPDGDALFLRPRGEATPRRLLSYALAEGRDETAIFFCHGGGGNKNQWRFQWRQFADEGYRLVAWDNLGHGQSPHQPEPGAYAGEQAVRDYAGFFQRFGTRRNVLVAHSYGCRQTLALLMRLRDAGELDRIAGVVLLGPPLPDTPLTLGPLFLLPAFALRLLRPHLAAHFRRLAWHPDTDTRLIAHEEAVANRNSLAMTKALLTGALRLDPGELADLRVPVHIACGTADRLTPGTMAQRLATYLPDARLSEIPGAGHQIMLEQPEATNRIIRSVLSPARDGRKASWR